MQQDTETELVDFSAVERDPTGNRPKELVRHLAALFSISHKTCSDEQIEVYDRVLLKLADMVEVETRAYLAAALAPLERAPRTVIRKLAFDEIAVAQPVIRLSPVLTERDLTDIVELTTSEHIAVMTRRKELSETVTDAIIKVGDDDTLRNLSANPGARMSHAGYRALISKAEGNEALQKALGDRADLPTDLLNTLIEKASESVRKRLVQAGRCDEAGRIDEAREIVKSRMAGRFARPDYDFEGALATVQEHVERDELDEAVLESFASWDKYPEMVCCLSLMSGVSIEQLHAWTTSANVRQYLMLMRILNLSKDAVRHILSCGPWRYRLSRDARLRSVIHYERIDREAAERVARSWGRRRAALH